MFCPHCGSEQVPGANYCNKCGAGVSAVVTKSLADFRRPGVVTLLAVLAFIAGSVWLIGGIALLLAVWGDSSGEATPLVFAGAVLLLAAALQITTAVGLLRLKPYGRTLQIALACLGLLGIPIGTLISIAILIYMFRPGVKLLFSTPRDRTLSVEEVKHLEEATSSQTATIVIAVVAVVILMVFFIGIIAAIAVPGLLRARIAGNEAVAIGTLRAIASAEATYAVNNGGYFDSVNCLAAPANCLPGFSGTRFLLENYTERSGYRFEYQPGRAPSSIPPTASRSSVESFVVVATPVSPSTGLRRFCLDASLEIRQTADVTSPVAGSHCPDAWPKVE